MPDETEGFAPEPGPGLFPELEPDDGTRAITDATPITLRMGDLRVALADIADDASTTGDIRRVAAWLESRALVLEAGPPQTLAEASEAMLPSTGEPPGKLAHVEVKGFRDLGVVRVSESTLGGVAMLRAESADGAVAEFPASSLHFITWLPEGATEADVRRALPAGAAHDAHDGFGDRDGWDGEGPW